MRLGQIAIGLLAVLTPFVAAWSKEDHEIFRVQDEVALHEAPGSTFYSVLGISSSATVDEITKAHRRKTLVLHPDKVRQQFIKSRNKAQKEAGKAKKAPPPSTAEVNAVIKEATERQARLMLIVNILRDDVGRERYDHFLKNGFPVWKGTGYYYNRYRPGLGTVLFGLFVFAGGGIHYLALYMGWRRQREFIERYIKFARETAWGADAGIPGIDTTPPLPAQAPSAPDTEAEEDEAAAPMPVNRKQRRMQERGTKRDGGKDGGKKSKNASTTAAARGEQPRRLGPIGPKRRVIAENGKVLVVDSLRDVYLEAQDEQGNVAEYLLDPEEIPRPTIHDTVLFRLPMWLYASTVSRAVGALAAAKAKSSTDDSVTGPSSAETKHTPAVDTSVRAADNNQDAASRSPVSDSPDDFEFLDRPAEDVQASGAQVGDGKAGKRKGRKK